MLKEFRHKLVSIKTHFLWGLADICDGPHILGLSMRVIGTFLLAVLALVISLNACTTQRNVLEQVITTGELHVVTRNSATTYFMGPHGPAGLEYELMQRFADYLGVDLKVTVSDSYNDIIPYVTDGDVHFAAAGLTVTETQQNKIQYAPSYQTITQQVVYNRKNAKPKTIELMDGTLEVVANSSHSETLSGLHKSSPQIDWIENEDLNSAELMSMVSEELIDYTIANSNEVAYTRRYYPSLNVAFDISDPQKLAWAFPKGSDMTLYNEAVKFFAQLKESGELDQIIRHNYQHISNYDYNGTDTYMLQIGRRLPKYRAYFEEAGEKYNIDWRLLASISYQESHWRPEAVSPTGVRGIMMLTNATAKHLGVKDRVDPRESIMGGARYIRKLIDKVPSHIPEEDRVWIAIASYNVGYGHIEDVRILTKDLGGNPDIWIDIKANLPLLSKRKWYKKTKYGYARGWEPVRYVENIRSYYDILNWHTDKDSPLNNEEVPVLAFSSNAL